MRASVPCPPPRAEITLLKAERATLVLTPSLKRKPKIYNQFKFDENQFNLNIISRFYLPRDLAPNLGEMKERMYKSTRRVCVTLRRRFSLF